MAEIMRIKERIKKGFGSFSLIIRRPRRRGQAPPFWFRACGGWVEQVAGMPCLAAKRAGQAMTEVVLLLPIFMIIVFITAKLFAVLVLVQKMEIASFYAARRWQLESHLSAGTTAAGVSLPKWDTDILKKDIEDKVKDYIGLSDKTPAVKKFLNLSDVTLEVVSTQVWNIVTLTVITDPGAGVGLLCPKKYAVGEICAAPYDKNDNCRNGYAYICSGKKTLEIIKYVPNRDRPIQFVLPGIK